MGKRGPKPREAETREWTNHLAYCVGLLATDGCLYNDGRHISFVSSDVQLVELFKNLMMLPNKVGYKAVSSSGHRCPHIQFGNVGFYKWLLSIGLTPRKSLTLGPLKIPKQFFVDFVRGCFDGDGSIHSYMDPRWANSHMFYISFASASKTFTEWLQKQLANIVGVNGYITTAKYEHKHNMYQLRFAKRESLVLIKKMFYNKQVPCLERKRQKILGILDKHYQIQSENPRIFLTKSAVIDI
jgi:hypothetical protein